MGTSRTALYLRESVEDTDGIIRHRKACLEMCAAKGWTVSVEFVDNDESASPEHRHGKPRPAYEQMLADVRAGRIDRIVCWHADRLYRHPRDLEDIIDLCRDHNVGLATVSGDLDLSTDMGRQVARILGAVARGEVERKSARQKLAGKQRAENGKVWWPSRPFGFDVLGGTPDGETFSTKGKEIVLHPVEAPLIREAYRTMLRGGALHAIAADWNSRGVSSPKGCVWRGAQVRQVLLNCRNAGLRGYDLDPRTMTKERVEQLDLQPADWPAIVDRSTWEGLVHVLSEPGRKSGADRARKYLLSGIAMCGVCGRTMGSNQTSAGAAYICKRGFCTSRNAARVDQWVTTAIIRRLARPDAAELTVDRDQPDLAALRQEADVLQARLSSLGVAYAAAEITMATVTSATKGINEQLAAINRQMNDSLKVRVFDGVIGADDVQTAWDELHLDRKRAIISALMSVTIMPSGRGRRWDPTLVQIDWLEARANLPR